MAFFYLTEYIAVFKPLLFGLPFVLTYLITSFRSSRVISSRQEGQRPPVSPYWIPGLGHSISFLWDTASVAKLTRINISPPIPIRLKLFNTEINFVTGADNIIAVWRSKVLEAREVTSFSLRYFFNTPKAAMKIYRTDDSGINLQPHPSSNVPFQDRYYFHTRKDTVGFFNGPGLKHIASRFQELLRKQVSQLEVQHNWVEFMDLYSFIQDLLTAPAIEAMCGPTLLDQSPMFVEDFWRLDKDILSFFKGCPRWLAPRAWKNREKLLASLKNWHAYARENFDESCVEADGHDRFYGSPLMRSRQNYLPKIDSLDADALASQDLGLIWAENANSIPAVFWLILELLQRPEDLSRAREEIAASGSCLSSSSPSPGNPQCMDIDSLCSKPLLQSAYAETLRLYTSLFALRSPAHDDFKLGPWTIPKDELIAVDSFVAHRDKRVWNTGQSFTTSTTKDKIDVETNNPGTPPHPVSQFWAARFLQPDNDYPTTNGPIRFNNRPSKPQAQTATASEDPSLGPKAPRFTMDGLSGAWLPFGGGPRQCPGRNFAKQEIIISFAAVISAFEIELLPEKGVKGGKNSNDNRRGLPFVAPKPICGITA